MVARFHHQKHATKLLKVASLLRLQRVLDEKWDAATKTLSGKSAVVVDDPYVMTLRLPDGFRIVNAEVGGEKVEIANQEEFGTVRVVPSATNTVEWKLTFAK